MNETPQVRRQDVPEDMLGFDAPYNPPAFPPPSYLHNAENAAPAAPVPERDVPPTVASAAEAPGMTPLVTPPVYERKSGPPVVRVPARVQAGPIQAAGATHEAGPVQARAALGTATTDLALATPVAAPLDHRQRPGAPMTPPEFADRPAPTSNNRAPNNRVPNNWTPDVTAPDVKTPDRRA